MRKTGVRQWDAGMTLVEVLLAIAILGLVLVVILTAVTRCLAVLRVSDDYHRAMWALSMGEAEHPLILGRDSTPEDLEVSSVQYEDITYSRLVEDPDVDAPDAELRLLFVTTTLEWEGRGNKQRIVVPQYLLFRE
ncbi:MAG: type II secretion system protein [Kiritimatiellia bacterium]